MIINWFDMLKGHEEGIEEGLRCDGAFNFGIRTTDTPYRWVVLSGKEVLREGEIQPTRLKIYETLGTGVYNPEASARLTIDSDRQFNEGLWTDLRSRLVGELYDDREDYARIVLELARCVLNSLSSGGDVERWYIAMTLYELREFIVHYEEWFGDLDEMPSDFLLRGVVLVRECIGHLEGEL